MKLDSTNVKEFYRRAHAHIGLVDLDLAEEDIKRALEIDPDNRYCIVGYLLLWSKGWEKTVLNLLAQIYL
jgi:FK506-binding protein 4/5